MSHANAALAPAPRTRPTIDFVAAPDFPGAHTAASGGFAIAFAGDLQNGDDLRRQLGVEWRASATDADIVLAAYRRWGNDALPRLRGAFALLVRDERTRTLLAARDPLGVHPLFYAEAGGTVLFSVSIDALLAQPGVSGDVNRWTLLDHLRHRFVDARATYFDAVERIPPGHAMEVTATGSRVYRYWDPVPADSPVEWIEEDELDRFDDLMEQAVARCLDGRRAGIFLSGGLDSVSIAAVATDISRRGGVPDPWALSLGFPDPDCNEETVQTNVAAELGLRQVLLPLSEAVGPRGLLEGALDTTATAPAPLLNFWQPAYRSLASEGARRGCEVVLTGSGGDEWLTPSPFLAADLLRRLDLAGLYRLGTAFHRSYQTSRVRALRTVLWTFGARALALAAAEKRTPRVLRALRRHREDRLLPPWLAPDPVVRRELRDRGGARQRQSRHGFYVRDGQLALDHPLVAMEIEEVFGAGERAGVPIRMPFWDADLVDFLYRTPPALLNDGGRTKAPVRRMLARRFPELGFERHKKVAAARFFRSVVADEGPRAWMRLGGVHALADIGIVDGRAVSERLPQMLSGSDHSDASRAWDILNLETWLRSRLGS